MDQISNASAHPSKDSIFKVTLDLLTTTLFLVFTGGLFVAFSIFLGKYELLILAFVLLGSSCFRSVLNPEQRKKYEMTPLVGEGLRIYNKLEQHYLHNAPRSIFYYLLFPITGIWSFFFSKKQGRSELKAYFGLIQWIIVLLVAESFTSYFRFYNQFKLSFVLSWFYLELLCIYFLCNFFAVPLSTSSLKLSLAGKQKRLFASTFLALIIMSGFLYLFLSNGSYKNIIPVNILLDQRMATLQPLSQNLSAEEKRRQAFLHPKKSYFQRFEAKTKMFLNHHAPKILAFNRSYYPIPSQKQSHLFYQDLNQKYQKHIAPLSVFNEEEHFFISTTRGTNEIWGILVIPFRESVLYIFHFKAGKLKLYHKWKDIPSPERKKLRKRWAPGLFVFGRQKRFSQIIVEYARNKVKDLQQVPSPASPDYPGKQERKSRSKKKKRSYPAEEGYPRPPAAGSSLMKKSQTGRSKSAARIQKSELRKRRLQSFKNLIAKRNQAIEIWKKWSLPLLQGFHTIPTIKNQNVYTFFNSKWPKEWKKRSQSLFWTRLSKLSKSLDQKGSKRLAKSFNLQTKQMEALMQMPKKKRSSEQKKNLEQVFKRLEQLWSQMNKQLKDMLTVQRLSLPFQRQIKQQLKASKIQRAYFVVYDQSLREFDYSRALSAKLLRDHFGETPQLRETWWTIFYGWFLYLLVWLFELTMPIHIAMIIYCQITIKDIEY